MKRKAENESDYKEHHSASSASENLVAIQAQKKRGQHILNQGLEMLQDACVKSDLAKNEAANAVLKGTEKILQAKKDLAKVSASSSKKQKFQSDHPSKKHNRYIILHQFKCVLLKKLEKILKSLKIN